MYPDLAELREAAGSGRVYPGDNSLIPSGIRSVYGYHAAKTVETDKLLGLLSGSSPWVIRQTAVSAVSTDRGTASWEQIQPLLAEETRGFPEAPMPRAFVPRSVAIGSSDDGFGAIASGLNPQIRSVVEGSPSVHDGVLGSAIIVTDDPEHVTIRTETDNPGFVVLADTWYPRWQVEVDGKEETIYRANGWMRAVPVPEGEHTVDFTYDTGHIRTGGIMSLAGLLAAAALVFALVRKHD
jgi:hypothetical protein